MLHYLRLAVTALSLTACVLVVAVGCRPEAKNINGIDSTRLPKSAFITPDKTLQQVIDRVGEYDRVRGSVVPHYQYNLPDGSAVLLRTERPMDRTSKITAALFYKDKDEIDVYP